MSCADHLLEIDSLRSQIAELSRTLAERDQSMQIQQQSLEHVMQDLRAQSDLLKAIAEGTAADTGDEFFASLATHLTASLHMQYAVIGEIVDGTPVTVRTLAIASGGALLDNFEYDLTQAPCGTALTESFWCYEQGVQALFPHFPLLAALGVHSHSGVFIRNKQGDAVGLIVIMDTKPITNQEQLQALLHIFAPRVAAELQRKDTETALQEQARRLAHAQALAHLGSWGWEIGSGRMEWSDEQFRIFGHKPGSVETTHETFLAALLPDDHDRMLSTMNATLVDHAPFDLECGIVRPDGEVRVIHTRGEVCRDETGHPIRMVGTVLDITERKQVERALRVSEERWHLAVQGSNDGIWDWNIQTGAVFFSPRWKAMRGFAEHEITNHVDEWRSRIHPDDLDLVLQSVDAYLAKQAPEFSEEYRVQRKDGSYMWILDRGVALWADDGRPLRMAGSESDISDRKRAEESLAASKKQLRDILDSLFGFVALYRLDGRIVEINRAPLEIAGVSKEDVLDRYFWETPWWSGLPDMQSRLQEWMSRAAQGELIRGELVFRVQGGCVATAETTFGPLRDATGAIINVIGFGVDTTERKRAEEAVRGSEERLRQAVRAGNIGIFDHAHQSDTIYWSPEQRHIYGWSSDEPVTLATYLQHVYEEDRDRIADDVRRAHDPAGDGQFDVEHRIVDRHGAMHWLNTRSRTLFEGEGPTRHKVRTIGAVADITERKQAEAALRSSESRLKEAQRIARIGNWELDLRTNNLVWSDEIYRIFEIDPAGFPASYEAFLTLVHPDDREMVNRAYSDSVATRTPYDITHRLLMKDGKIKFVQERCRTDYSPDGTPERSLGTVQDVTERKQVESKLRLAQFTIDHATDAVYWINREAQIVDVNEAASLMLGYSKDELCAMTVYDLNPDFQADRWPGFRAEARQRKTMAFETVHRSKTGELIPVEVSINCLSYEGQELHCAFVRDISERKKAQEELRRSKSRLTYILENNPAVVYARQVGDGWPMTFITPNIYELLGYTSVDILSDPNRLDNLMHPDDERDLVTRGMPQLLRDGERSFVYRLRHRDGTHRWIENRTRLNDNGKGALQIVGTMIDVTERKKAEEALEEERHRLVTAQLLAHLGSWEWNILTGIKIWSDESCRIFGYDPGSIQPTYEIVTQAIHPQDRERVLQAARATLEDDTTSCDLECRIVWPSGEVRHVHCRGEVTRDDAGQPLKMAGTVLDITERKQTQEALARRERQLQTVLDALPVGVWFTDPSGKPLLANPAAKQIWSAVKQVGIATAGNAIGWWETIRPSDELHRWALSHVLTKGVASLNETLDLECLDGTIKTIRNSTVPVRDDAGAVLGAIVLNEDITALRRAQETIKLTQFSVDHAVEGFFWIGPDARILHVNEAACRMLEYTQDELTSMTVHDIDPNFPLEAWPAHWEELKQKGFMSFESKHWSRSGRVLDTEVTVNFLQHEGREYNCAIMRDIGERKRTDAALRESEELFAKTFRSSPYPIVLSELDTGCFIDANDASFELTGYRREEIAGQTANDIGLWPNPEDRRRFVAYLKHVGSIRNLEIGLRNKEGDIRQCLISAERIELNGKSCMITVGSDITEQKRAEEALRVSQERYRSLVDNAPIGIFVNEAGRFTYVNREMQRILRATSAEQLLGTPVLDRIAPEFHQVAKDRIHQLMENGQPVPSLDEQYVGLDGSRVDVAVTAIPTTFDGITVMQVLVLDVTERKKAEEELREKHALLSAIMDATIDIVFVKDLKGRYLHMNPAGARAVGMSVEEVVGKDDDAIWPADLAACCKIADQQVLASGSAQTMEESTTVDGHRITYLTTKAPYRDATGRMIGIIGVAHNISQIKRSEEELRRSHAFLRQVIDIDPNFVFAKDRAGRFTLVNKAVAEAYGTTVENLIGKTDADFNVDQQEIAFFREKDLEVMNSLRDLFLPEERITDSTGRMRWLQTVKRPILDEQGQAIMVLGAATDITERKRMEEALRQRERDLRTAIEERERISQDLHDGILQSLFAVGLTLETTKSMMAPKERKMSGPALKQAIDQLNRLMHEVRNFIAGLGSDLLQGKDLPTALQHMIETLTKHHPTHVRLKIEDRAAQALSAEQSLHVLLVIQEAVSNCIRHGHAQEATVSLKLLKQGVRLSVRDNGCGFDSAASKGIGHGLANMAARAQRIGGRLTVLSKTNEGTRVVLDLPKEAVLAHS